MGQDQNRMAQSEGNGLGHSRRKNIFNNTSTPVQSEQGSNRDSRPVRQESNYVRSVVSPVHQYQQDEVRSQNYSQSKGDRSEVVNAAMQNLLGQQNYEELPPAERYPTRLTYFNAWSLPIQKYYIEERGPYQGEEEEEEVVEVKQYREMKEFDSGELEGLMAEKMKEEMVATNSKNRRQNLNMV